MPVEASPSHQKVNSVDVPQTPSGKNKSMGLRVVCATPHRGKRALDNYSLGDRIGRGAFAAVYKAIHLKTGEFVAIKQIPLARIKAVESVMGEIELLQALEHPNITKYLGFMKDNENLSIVLEYCENGSLASIVRKFGSFPENLLAVYMRQVLGGLVYLHDQGTIHRDIKGANILTTKEGIAKLADFGVATRQVTNGQPHGVVGTPHWMAPEVVLMQEPTPSCDIWSLGSTIVELKTGRPPHGDLGDIAAMYATVQEDIPPIPTESSGSLRDFLGLCFEKDPALRVKARDLVGHRWIRKFGGDTGPIKPPNEASQKSLRVIPSRLDLKAAFGGEQDDDIEGAFQSLSLFGPPPKTGGTTRRQPDALASPHRLSDFVDSNDDWNDLEGDLKPRERNLEDMKSIDEDPFDGLDDLDDPPDELLALASDEIDRLLAHVTEPRIDLTIVLARFSELLGAAPQAVRVLQQRHVLANVLPYIDREKNLKVYLSLAQEVLTDSQQLEGFCLTGGLAFVLHNCDWAPEESSTLLEHYAQSVPQLLAFREDALAALCRLVTPETGAAAARCILAVFNAAPRLRAELWEQLNSNSLFHRVVNLLHVAPNDALEPFYQLIASFSRTSLTSIAKHATRPALRRLMRAYVILPRASPYRLVVLRFFRDTSSSATVLEALHRGAVAPHLINALNKALGRDEQAHSVAACLLPTFYNYCRLSRSRQREVAEHGLIPVLQATLKKEPALREFAIPIFCWLAHAAHPQCFNALANSGGLETIVGLVTEPGWESQGMAALNAWLMAESDRLQKHLKGISHKLVMALEQATDGTFPAVTASMSSLFENHAFIRREVLPQPLFKAINCRLNGVDSSTAVQLLQMALGVLETQYCGSALIESGLAASLTSHNELPGLAQKLAARILATTAQEQAHSSP